MARGAGIHAAGLWALTQASMLKSRCGSSPRTSAHICSMGLMVVQVPPSSGGSTSGEHTSARVWKAPSFLNRNWIFSFVTGSMKGVTAFHRPQKIKGAS